MSNSGVFGWIRESVRKSVLLGFSDAVEQIGGTADNNEGLNPQFAAMLREAAPRAIAEAPSRPEPRQQRKRLGRSLEQLRQPPKSEARGE